MHPLNRVLTTKHNTVEMRVFMRPNQDVRVT